MKKLLLICAAIWLFTNAEVYGQNELQREALTESIERGIERISAGVDNYPKHRDCFSCHHQAVPLLAYRLNAAEGSQGKILWGDQAQRRDRILDFTRRSLERELASLKPEQELGGRGMTLGYALWTLSVGQTTWGTLGEELVNKAISTQMHDGRWRVHSVRPPAASSEMMATALVISGLNHYEKFQKDAFQAVSLNALQKARYRAMLWRARQAPRDRPIHLDASDGLGRGSTRKCLPCSPRATQYASLLRSTGLDRTGALIVGLESASQRKDWRSLDKNLGTVLAFSAERRKPSGG